MITIEVTKKQGDYTRLKTDGHAMFAESGRDIVCAGVSVLVINTVNSINHLTDCKCTVDTNQVDGYIDCTIDNPNHDSNLLIQSLLLGLDGIIDSYSDKYLQINIKEV